MQDRRVRSSNLTERSAFFTLIHFCFKMYKIYLRHTKILCNKSSRVESIETFEGIKLSNLAFSSSCTEMSTRFKTEIQSFSIGESTCWHSNICMFIYIYTFMPKPLKITFVCMCYICSLSKMDVYSVWKY